MSFVSNDARVVNTVTSQDLARSLHRVGSEPARDVAASESIAVLIAHSDPVISAGLAALLKRRRGFLVTVVQPGASGVSGAYSHDTDVIVTDYQSALRLAEADPGSSHRMLVLTDNDSESKICLALERGVGGYLLSGCSLEDLLRSIRVVHDGGVAVDPLVARRVAENMKHQALTPREQAILRQMMLGSSNKQIAVSEGLAVGTVKTHVKAILSKLKADSRTHAVIIAQRRGIVEGCGG